MDRTARVPTIELFGEQLLATGDLDPLYISLTFANLELNQLRRWLLAYWCCYHAGASSWISEFTGEEYWLAMSKMAANVISPVGERWPRGHERRHFRGAKATEAVTEIRRQHPEPEKLVMWLETAGPTFRNVRARVTTLPQFGPWIAFKVADMLERVMKVSISFEGADVFMFDSPREAALVTASLWSSNQGSIGSGEDAVIRSVSDTLISYFSRHMAPPWLDRPVNIQEVETILCKWKSHNNGHYPVGNDIAEIRDGLAEWAETSETAGRLLRVTPARV